MAINTSVIGKTYPTTTYEVTADAIRRYAAATNEDNPAFAGEDPVAPPAFLAVVARDLMGSVLFDPELEVNLTRLVHGEEDHVFHASIRPGDVLTVEGRLDSVEAKESGETFTVSATATNQEGVLAAEIRALFFVRGSGSRTKSAEEPAPEPEVAFSEVQKVDDDQTYRYAEASGDPNPIHTDPEFARNVAGLPGIILHGMCTMAFASKVVLDAVAGGDPARLKRIKVRFSRPVFPGETLTTRGWVAGSAGGRTTYGFETTNARGSAVLRNGVAEVLGG